MADFESKPVAGAVPAASGEKATPSILASSEQPVSAVPSGGGFFHHNKIYFVAIILGLGIIGILSFFAFKSPAPSSVKGANVDISIDAPAQVPSGTESIVKIKVQNKDTSKLASMELELVYAPGQTYLSSTPKPENLSGTLFNVPDLSTGQNAVVIVKIRNQGSVGDEKKLKLKLRYRYSNFSSEFVKEAEYNTKLVAAGISLDVEGPTSTTNTQLVTYVVKYRNHSDESFKSARISLNYPEGFVFASSEPNPSLAKNIWNLGQVKPNDEGKITVLGTYRSAVPGESKTLGVDFLVPDPDGNYYTQANIKFVTSIGSTPLLVTQDISQSDKDYTVNPGNTLNYEIKYQNNATVAARGVNIVVALDSKALDLTTIQAEGAQVNNNTITWNASSNSNLEIVNPNESGTLHFEVKVKNPPIKDSSKNVDVKSTVKIKSNEYDTFLPGNDLLIKVTSLASLTRTVEYVSGQLPPKVGQPTIFKVTLNLKNLTNDFSGGLLTAYIPLDPGSFDSSTVTSAEQTKVQFDPSTGKFTWNVGMLPAHTGDFSKPRTVSFNLRVVPVASQVSKIVTLLRDVGFTATDNYTQKDVSIKIDDVRSQDMTGDEFSGKGVVQP